MTPWLSLLLPVFRVRPYLGACLDSILAQCDDGVEVLLLDDASDDGSAELIEEFQRQQPGRLRLLRHARNQGISAARNSLLDAATGDYLWFIDPDDLLLPGAIAGLRRALAAQSQPDVLMCDFRILREQFKPKHARRGELHMHSFIGPSHQRLQDRSRLIQGLFEAGHLQPWCKIIKRSLWPAQLRFPVGRFFEDTAVMPRVILLANSYCHVPEVWIGYRKREGSVLAHLDTKKLDDMSFALSGFGAELRSAGVDKAARFSLAYFAAVTFISACRHACRQGARALLPLYLQRLRQTLDDRPESLRAQYLQRGWIWRWLRLQYWLRKAAAKT
ncbi:glycosyltransferase family 2 protein [Paucibacter sp. PLA-PC-4]|uniref:glycosyltransferase family 2 protein n=1 Tax=Paucibacter sp. PLA-PC-4 TaxID=2993655 RepID=UPI00224A8829|nr:glycosyltransferase family 2 protein [Paucibacter sp. PLA-PC-4]MCX2865552.1 glycosyltransferase family 2 protein [Paucibacter sp. PLA-PC-4]